MAKQPSQHRWTTRSLHLNCRRSRKNHRRRLRRHFEEFCQQTLNIVVSPSDISTCHRLGKSQTSGSKSCPMIVRFTNRKMKIAVMKAKKALRGSGVFINELLTRKTSAMFAKARTLIKQKRLYDAWT